MVVAVCVVFAVAVAVAVVDFDALEDLGFGMVRGRGPDGADVL